MDQTITRRRLIAAGALATLAATVAGLLPAANAEAAPPPLVPTVPSIDQAEALLVELCGILPHLNERDLSNMSCVLDQLSMATGGTGESFLAHLAENPLEIGPENRTHDRIDAEIAAARRAAVTHADVVARYAATYKTGEVGQVGTMIRSELCEAYGEDLGSAIAEAAFRLSLHQKYHVRVASADCESCNEDA
jgi:hypothetical protein